MISNVVIASSQVVAYWIVRLYRLVTGLKLDVSDMGSGMISRTEHVLIVANHQSRLDGFMLTTALPFRRFIKLLPVSYITKNSYLNNPIKRGLLYLLGLYPAKPMPGRTKHGLQASTARIYKGHTLFFFPEGRRSLARQERPKKGAMLLAKTHQLTVLPMYIDWTKQKKRRATIVIGAPRCLYGITPLAKQAELLMDHIYDLAG